MLKFLVLGDFHYKKNMYAATLTDLDSILQRAKDEAVDFVIHTGDFCNDYLGSPELLHDYLENAYGLPVFGIYGNHELETKGNTMQLINRCLSNQQVTFGGQNEGYWYYDFKSCRLVGLDSNYSYNETTKQWQHNLPASWGAPADNILKDSFSPDQLDWLDRVLSQAEKQHKKVIVFSHTGLSGKWASSADAEDVRKLFAKYSNTVIMSINGHLHTDHFCLVDGIAYFDVNAVVNGFWMPSDTDHYNDDQTFTRECVDEQGVVTGMETFSLRKLTQGKNTWFFKDPLSAVVEIADDNSIKVKGSATSWLYDVIPSYKADCIGPAIPDRFVGSDIRNV